MATKLEEEKWQLFQEKYYELFKKGVENKKIRPYSEEEIEKLREVYYGGIPASIILLSPNLCNGYCYDRALLLSHIFKEDQFQLVDANINSIRLNPEMIDDSTNKSTGKVKRNFSNHCFVLKKEKDGSVWVYDTTAMLVIEKDLYYQMEEVEITKINSKQATEEYFEYLEVEKADIERDKYASVLILPNIEKTISTKNPYREMLKREIEIFKEKIGYDALCKEVEEDMNRVGISNEEDTKLLMKMFNPSKKKDTSE